MNLVDILTSSARAYAHLPALSMLMGYRTVSLTYAELYDMAKKVALLLDAKGCVQGDRVVICAPNSPYWVAAWWGCMLKGCWAVPLSVQSTASNLEKIIKQTTPKLVFKSKHNGIEVQGNVPAIIFEQFPDILVSYDTTRYVQQPIQASEIAEIMFTSGTTGDPKGVLLTHANLVSNVQSVDAILQLKGTHERILSTLPLSHMLEQTAGMILPLSLGVHIIYAHSHGAIRDLLQHYRITKIISVPEFLKLMEHRTTAKIAEYKITWLFNALMKFSRAIGNKKIQRLLFKPLHRAFGGSLDTIASGGAPLDQALEEWWDAFGVYVLQGYGLTETSPVITINTYKQRRFGSVGKPINNVQMRITPEGEIEVKGPNVFTGYFQNDEKTRESFTQDGWFKTGDMGIRDADGFLFLKGRKKYMIKGPGAQNIFPEDIELILNELPGVKDSCVVGLPTPSGMVEIHAVLLLADDASPVEQLIQQANEKLASYQHITGWSVWPEQDFQRSVTRKVKKEMVLAWLASRHDGTTEVPVHKANQLVTLLAEISGVPCAKIKPTTTIGYDLKFDSLMRVELVTRVEELKDVFIDERLLRAQTTVAELENIIATAKPALKMPQIKKWPSWCWVRCIRAIGLMKINLLSRIFFKINVEGVEHLTLLQQPVVLMPNHVSLIDGLFVEAALPRMLRKKLSFAAAYDVLYEEYWYARWLAELFFNAFPFPRREHDHVMSGLLNVGTMLDKGSWVVLFPEGKVSQTGHMLPLKRGAGLIAVEMGIPIVPIKIVGAEKLVPYNCIFPRKRGTVTIKIGAPIIFNSSVSYDEATTRIAQEMERL
ncbi:MAG: AMP-binding protein [Candidatus Babeliales bacterium]|jgi:long-chain acyl-CoA synthetase